MSLRDLRVMATELPLEPWTPTVGSWEPGGNRWGWSCPDCGDIRFLDASAVDMRCAGTEERPHLERIGLRPDAEVSGPAALLRELMRLGTVQRISLLQGALTLAQRAGASDALHALADQLDHHNRAFVSPAELREMAALHLAGEL